MAEIGIIVGREEEFPAALIEHINRAGNGLTAEMVSIGGTALTDVIPYRVILDRISHEVPYYRAYLGKAVADGAIVVNNPFWWSADNKFIECVIAEGLGVAVPKTVLLPNISYEADIIDRSLRNLHPVDWDRVIAYVGLPAVIKPAMGGGSRNVSIAQTRDELIAAHQASGTLTMIVQEKIEYERYVRCFVLGRQEVRISGYDFNLPRHIRYTHDPQLTPTLHDRIVHDCLALTRALGYDMDTVELAIRDEIPYAIDFLNPAPEVESNSVGQANFDWMVEHVADLCLRYARGQATPPQPDRLALVGALPPLDLQPAASVSQ